MNSALPLTAPAIYALANGKVCDGPDNCHWCGAKCPRLLPHDDKRDPLIRTRNPHARFPGNQYQCIGCWLFGRQRISVTWLSGGIKDGQSPANHSWWMTPHGSWGVRIPEDSEALYKILLRPPLQFVLTFVEGKDPINRLQMALANDHAEIKASTPLTFTINDVPYCYNVYELEEALTSPEDLSGMLPGVRELVRLLGPYKTGAAPAPKREKGRPLGSHGADNKPNSTKNVVTVMAASGTPTVAEVKA